MKDKKMILGFGEIMLRLTPPNNQKIIQSTGFEATYSGAEANVMGSLSIFGHNTKFVTKIPNNNLGQKVINTLSGLNINVIDVIRGEGRLGVYYAEIGHGLRSTEIIYDRKNSAIALAKEDEFDIDRILEDVYLIHLSGITPALSKDLYSLTLKIAKRAKEKGILVSYDSNYREKLWSIKEAESFLFEILNYVDIAFLGYLDMTKILAYEDLGETYEDKLLGLYKKLLKQYPNIKYAASTKRTVNSVNNNNLKGYLFNKGNLYTSSDYNFDIIDRIGGGDAFTAGIINGVVKKVDEERIVEFATCASSLKHSISGDINLVDEATINQYIDSGLSNIKR